MFSAVVSRNLGKAKQVAGRVVLDGGPEWTVGPEYFGALLPGAAIHWRGRDGYGKLSRCLLSTPKSDQFRGARIHLCDLSGLEIRDCDVTGLKIVDCYGGNVYLGGGFERVVVNDVDVTAYVEAELDRLHPNRVLAREATSAAEYRAAWDAIEKQWEATLDRARRLPEAKLHEQVNGEWSFVETQRHLLMASDAWLGNAVLEEDAPYHPLGLPGGGMPPEASAKLGLTLDATPTLDEVLAPRLARMATMRRVVDGLTEAELDRVCGRKPADPYPDREYVVRRCLSVGAQGRGRASPVRGARPRRARGRCPNRAEGALPG